MDALDRTDKAILRILQRDASLSNVALAPKSISVRRRAFGASGDSSGWE